MEKIAILDTGYNSYEYEHKVFVKHGYELIIFHGPASNMEMKTEFASEACGILVRDSVIGASALERMPRLKAIVRYGVGYDNIDLEAATAKGIRVANVQGYANHAVSDHALALMFACTRDLQRDPSRPFGKPSRKELFELHNKTLGIIGVGRIGSHFSRKASPLFQRTLAYDPYRSAEYLKSHGAEKGELEELLRESHVISLHCNLTEETRHMINGEAFETMQNTPVLINTARGAVIEESALLAALDAGKVHSAGLDVYETEPPGAEQAQLMDHPHVISTPHIAWYSETAIRELQQRAADNMIGLLSGRQISDEIRPHA